MHKLTRKILALLSILCLFTTIFSASVKAAETLNGSQGKSGPLDAYLPCNSDELNHSVLVECNITQCGDETNISPQNNLKSSSVWPTTREKLLHIYSSRVGVRFAQIELDNLNYQEDATTKLLNINTTLSIFIKTDSKNSANKSNVGKNKTKLLGIGATLDAARICNFKDLDLDKSYGLILDDLFKSNGANLNILRLLVSISADQLNNNNFALGKLLQDIDQHVAHSRNYNSQEVPLKILLDLKMTDNLQINPLEVIVRTTSNVFENLSSIQLWAIALDHTYIVSSNNSINQDYYHWFRKSFPSIMLLASSSFAEAPNVEYKLMANNLKQTIFQGLLLNGQQAIPYDLLEYLSIKQLILLTVGSERPKTSDYGDWANAQAEAVEILKHLQHGSMGFIENLSNIDLLESGLRSNQDSSLYNLHMSHQTHFRGPMFYATSHFSRYISPGSEPLDIDVFTQPNMFSAHYGAFKTPNNYVVTIVLNNNDHLLPFQLELDNTIVAHTYLEPKSFNTILMKL